MFYTSTTSLLKSYNFAVTIGDETFYQIRSITLPNYGLEIKADLLGDTVQHTPAKGQWQPVTIEFYDYKYRDPDGQTSYDSISHRLFETLTRAKGKSITGNDQFKVYQANLFQTGKDTLLPDIRIKKIYGDKYERASTTEAIVTGAPGAFKLSGQQVSETWILKKCTLAGVDFGKMDYASEDINIITVMVQYSNAIHTTQA